MTPTLVPKLRATPSIRRQHEDHSPPPEAQRPLVTAVIVDECDATEIELLLSIVGSDPGPKTIVLTRHPIPPCVVGLGAGTEATVMWNEGRTEWRASVDTTSDRLRTLRYELRSLGRGSVESIDSFPTWRPLRSLHRREVDGLVRTLVRLQPDRIVVDPSHHLVAELHAAIERHGQLGKRLARPVVNDQAVIASTSPLENNDGRPLATTSGRKAARQDDLSAFWIDLGGSE